jgi:hypothetical protein
MEINNLNESQFTDMFGMAPKAGDAALENDGFNRIETDDSNIFSTTKTPEELEAEKKAAEDAAKTDDKKLDENGNPIEEGGEGDDKDKGIFIHDEDKKKLGRKPKYEFSDTSGYFEDRIKNGKFVPAVDENDKPFVPKTPEEFDEFFELQINHKLDEKSKEIQDNWYKQLSPAWQAVARYATKVSHPSEVIPFIEGVRNIDTIGEINEKEPEGAEQIVRYRMKLNGDPQEIVDEQIQILKETNKLVSTAERYKPLLVKSEQIKLANLQKEREEEERNYLTMVTNYRTKAIEKIESQVFGKQKLKDDEKALVYDLIGEPDPQQGGYAIYSEIDKLYETQDFDTLRDIALFLKKKDAFLAYISKQAADKSAEAGLRKIKVAATSSSSGTDDDDTIGGGNRQVIRRQTVNPNQGFRRQ